MVLQGQSHNHVRHMHLVEALLPLTAYNSAMWFQASRMMRPYMDNTLSEYWPSLPVGPGSCTKQYTTKDSRKKQQSAE